MLDDAAVYRRRLVQCAGFGEGIPQTKVRLEKRSAITHPVCQLHPLLVVCDAVGRQLDQTIGHLSRP